MNFKPTPTRCPGTARDKITVSPARWKGRSLHRLPVYGNYFFAREDEIFFAMCDRHANKEGMKREEAGIQNCPLICFGLITHITHTHIHAIPQLEWK